MIYDFPFQTVRWVPPFWIAKQWAQHFQTQVLQIRVPGCHLEVKSQFALLKSKDIFGIFSMKMMREWHAHPHWSIIWPAPAAYAIAVVVAVDRFCKAVFMHDPVGFYAFGRFPLVEHKSLLHSYVLLPLPLHYHLVRPRRLPISQSSCSIRSNAVGVLSISWGEEVPLFLPKSRFS